MSSVVKRDEGIKIALRNSKPLKSSSVHIDSVIKWAVFSGKFAPAFSPKDIKKWEMKYVVWIPKPKEPFRNLKKESKNKVKVANFFVWTHIYED